MEKRVTTEITLSRAEVADIVAAWLNERVENARFEADDIEFFCEEDGDDLREAKAVCK